MAVAVGLVALLLASVARLYHPPYGFTEMIGFASPGTGELPVLQAIPHYRHPPWGSYDGQFYAQLALEPSAARPRDRRRSRPAALSRAPHPLQLDRMGTRARPAGVDPPGVRAPEPALLADSRARHDALAAARHATWRRALDGVPLLARFTALGSVGAARRAEHAAHCPGHRRLRARPALHLRRHRRRRRTGTRDEPARFARLALARRTTAVVEARRRARPRGAAPDPLAGLPARHLSIDERGRSRPARPSRHRLPARAAADRPADARR